MDKIPSTDIYAAAKTYDNRMTVILALIIIIPIVLGLVLCTYYTFKPSATTQDIKPVSLNVNTYNEFGAVQDTIVIDDDKCRDYVNWVYSNRAVNPVYAKCNIKTIDDAFRWIICNSSTDNASMNNQSYKKSCDQYTPDDKSRFCSKVFCDL
jgi:hypothetical protein